VCNLYTLNSTRFKAGQLFKVSHNRTLDFAERLTFFPGHVAPIVRLASDGEREMVNMTWGFVLLRDGYAPKRVTNTRDDKMGSPFWRDSIEERRCLVPVTSFAEPDEEKPVRWHWLALRGDEPRPLFAFAGIWRRWRGPVKKDGPTVEQDVYSFMTSLPNELTARINHERLPVILGGQEEHETWLHGNAKERKALLKPYPAEAMREVQASTDKMDRHED